jgi:RHS repeat-associated protein
VKKISGGSAFVYIGKLFECVAPCKVGSVWSGTKHLFAGSVRIASKPITTTGEIAYYHPDHLGSTSVVTDKNGAITAEFAYLPFGESYPTDNPAVHYKYTGKERDTETALYFYGARYYDSRIGRFISADSIVQSKRNPQFLNRYSYVMNNPVKLIDPSGHVATCGVWGSSCGNSGVNNPCGNGNCGPTPPSNSISQNSASGTGGQGCPPGGCFGAPGTSEGLGFGSSRQAGIVPVPVVSTGTQEIVPILIAVSSPGSVPPMSELSTAVSSLINTEEMQFGGTCTSAAPCTMLGNLTYLPHLDAYRLTLKGPYRGIVFVKGISSVSDDYSIKPTETNFGFVVHDAEVTPHCCYPAPPFFTDNYGQKHAQVGYIDVTYGDATSRISGFKTHEWQTTFDTGGPTNPGQDFML